MLARLLGKKIDHPLADIKAAHALLDDLPKNDALRALMELTDWMESVVENGEFKLDYQFALICLLDETSATFTRKLSREYFAVQELPKFQENRLWLVLGNWYRNAALAYFTVFSRYSAGEKSSSNVRTQLPLLVARTVALKRATLKFACVHYGPIDTMLWTYLGRLYKHAEHHAYLETPVHMYASQGHATTVKSEVAHLLAWYGCGVNSLSPLAMHLTERIIAEYIALVDIHPYPTEHSLFGFDLNSPSIPRRVNIDSAIHADMRFISMVKMAKKLEALLTVLDKNIVPSDLILAGDYEADLVHEAVSYLRSYVVSLPQRRAARKQAQVLAKVARGFQRAIKCTDSRLDFNEDVLLEWQLKNISLVGFYTVLSQQGNDPVRIGDLLIVKLEGSVSWGVALIRRLLRDETHQTHVGVEIISNQIATVTLTQSLSMSSDSQEQQLALWLYPRIGEEKEGSINLLVSRYVSNGSFETELNGKKYLLMSGVLKQKNLDCDLVEFRVIQRDESEE